MNIRLTLHVRLLGMLCVPCSGIAAAAPLILRTAETHPADYPTALAISHMGILLDDWSGSELAIKLYAGGQLGEEKDTGETTIFGGIDLNRINMAPLTSVVPETTLFGTK